MAQDTSSSRSGTAEVKIELADVRKTFTTEGHGTLDVLKGVTAEILDKEFVALIGPSGCGKSTLLNIVAGLLAPTSGRVLLDGQEVRGPGAERGMVFQQDAILMWRKVLGNVEYGLELRGVPKEERRRIAMEYIRLVGLEQFTDFFPKELSGGMRKRCQIAAVFANNPEVLLMDEPFGSLDYPTKVTLQEEVLKIWAREQKTTLFVTHDVEEALFLADRVFVVQQGRIATIVPVPFARPRQAGIRALPEFRDLLVELWAYLSERA
ncbi:MAG: sulfonate transport system ATP-binding protein [Thermomicrobiales bacterium]|jgi:NitT/TauT family transport system ATP-binding protein|nr:sulfonate transport system ATP-binding protein [Thermomicrobiales bacterium]